MSEFAKLPDPTDIEAGEFAKSRSTRKRILDAMIGLLAHSGYAATSTPAVAKAAGLSRTAMLYHFSSRRALLEAVVQHVTRRRVEMHEEMLAGLPRDERFRAKAVDAGWVQLQSPEFKAYCELATAARTDAELDDVFQAALENFDRARRNTALALAEPAVAESATFDLRRDLHRLILEGMATRDEITFDRDKRAEELFAFVKRLWSDDGEALLQRAVTDAERSAAED